MLKFNPTPKDSRVIDINKLPNFGFSFFFKNRKGYRLKFILLTIITVAATLTSFGATWLLAYIVNHIAAVTLNKLFTVYIPIFMALVFAREWGGYYIRKYGEMLPINYTNHLKLRFFNTWLQYGSNRFMNYSKEKLIIYQDKYIQYVFNFLNDWNWMMARNLTLLGIIIGILLYQSPWILLINVAYMVGFLALSMYLSRVIAKPLKKYHEADNDQNRVKQNFILNLFPIKKLHRNEFFIEYFKKYIQLTNKSIEPFRQIHANRWFLQLNLFNVIFAITFFYGIYQVIQGQLPIGYILLLQFAFTNLLNILIYFVEYYTGLINQKQDIVLFKEEIKGLQLQYDPKQKIITTHVPHISLVKVKPDIDKAISLNIKIHRGDKIAIIGPSGSGKSTLINVLLGLIEYNYGSLYVENKFDNHHDHIFGKDYNSMPYIKNIAYVNCTDPLLDMTLWENICLDNPTITYVSASTNVHAIIVSLGIHEFVTAPQFDQPISKLNLSTGQVQRIKLARALYSNADIYFFDEPYNGIDELSKAKCMSFIKHYLADKTVIMVTHHDYEIPAEYIRYEIENNNIVKTPQGASPKQS